MGIFSTQQFLVSASFVTTGSPMNIPPGVGPLANLTIQTSSASLASQVMNFEATVNGTDYTAVQATNLTTGTAASQTIGTGEEIWRMNVAGLNKVRLNLTAISGCQTAVGKLVL